MQDDGWGQDGILEGGDDLRSYTSISIKLWVWSAPFFPSSFDSITTSSHAVWFRFPYSSEGLKQISDSRSEALAHGEVAVKSKQEDATGRDRSAQDHTDWTKAI
jgi:hypothetical protein